MWSSRCAGCSLTASRALTSSIQQRAGEAYKSEIVLKERAGAEQRGPSGNELTLPECLLGVLPVPGLWVLKPGTQMLTMVLSGWLLVPRPPPFSTAGICSRGANGGMHTPRALWSGRQQAHRAAPALYLEILGKEGEMSSLKWHCNPQRGLLLKQTVCSALRRELRAAQLRELFKI